MVNTRGRHLSRCLPSRALFAAAAGWILTVGAPGSALAQDLAGPPAAVPPVTVASPAAPDVVSALTDMRDEIVRLRAEIGALRDEVRSLGGPAGTSPVAVRTIAGNVDRVTQVSAVPVPADQPQLEVLQSQIEELSQSKVESSSRLPLKLFGTILSNTAYNSDEANWLESPNIVNQAGAGGVRTGSFTSTLRQSRIGLNVGSFDVGGAKASGTVIFDFFGGVPNFQTGTVMGLPRLIYAFARLDGQHTALQVGQDQTMFAPRDPTSLAAFSFPDLFRSGNLYLRAPQVRVEQKFGANWTVKGGIVAPVAGDFASAYEFAPAPGAGERSERPALETHLGFASGDADAASEVALGLSGHYGWLRQASGLGESWGVSADVNVRVGRVGFGGELFDGENLVQFGGGISQPGRSAGGWFEGRLRVASRTAVNAGMGLDRPRGAGAVTRLRRENTSAFANVVISLTPELKTSLEYRWLETRVRPASDKT